MNDYRYVVLRYQPSLHSSERENFAVIVEGATRKGRALWAIGRSLESSGKVSEIGNEVRHKFPSLLANLLREVSENCKPGQNVLDALSGSLAWNFQVSEPKSRKDQDAIHLVVFKLFAEEVAGADQILDDLTKSAERMIRPREIDQRLGETFLTAVPLADEWLVPA